MPHRLDTDSQVFCYVDEFYPLSNFSPFRLMWKGIDFDTSEHAYHWEKFKPSDFTPRRDWECELIRRRILEARSAHEAYKYAEGSKALYRSDWPTVRVGIMGEILRAKAAQHWYVRQKLMQTGDREIVEDSWRDGFWGWGPDRNGQNMLGKLWMEIREELRAKTAAPAAAKGGA